MEKAKSLIGIRMSHHALGSIKMYLYTPSYTFSNISVSFGRSTYDSF